MARKSIVLMFLVALGAFFAQFQPVAGTVHPIDVGTTHGFFDGGH